MVRSLFFKEEMELSLIGLNAAGKTSLVNVIAVSVPPPALLRARLRDSRRAPLVARVRVVAWPRLVCARVAVAGAERGLRLEPRAQTGAFSEDMIPTVGFNMRTVTKGNVSIKARHVPCRARCLVR